MFETYFSLGLHHIADITAYDHIIFLLAIATLCSFKDWRKLALMVTAFTIGHSLTLALAVFSIIVLPSSIIEFLIPVTIFFAAIGNLFPSKKLSDKMRYLLILVFGLIHGMGFSNFLIATLSNEFSVLIPLFGFNTGLEVGQLIIVFIYLIAQKIVVDLIKIKRSYWTYSMVGLCSIIAIVLMYKTKFW